MTNKILSALFIVGIIFVVSCSDSGPSQSIDEIRQKVDTDDLANNSTNEESKPPVVIVPKISLLSCPKSDLTNVSGEISFASDAKDAKFRCSLDGKPASLCSSPYLFSNLTLGEHVFSVEAFIAKSASGVKQTCLWKISSSDSDDGKPEVDPSINGFAATSLKGMKINLSWSDASVADSFKIFRNGQEIAEVFNKFSYIDMVPTKGEYSYFVKAIKNNLEDASNSVTASPVPVAGDVNGDGNPDFIVGATSAAGGGAAYLFLGAENAQEFLTKPAMKITNSQAPYSTLYKKFAGKVGLIGDVNGDGLEDVGVLALNETGLDGKVFVFFGSIAMAAEKDVLSADFATANIFRVSSFAPAGDVDKDGYDDFIVGTIGSQYAGLIKGRPSWSSYDSTDKLTVNFYSGKYVAASEIVVSGVADFNADGLADAGLIRCEQNADGVNFDNIVEVYDVLSAGKPAIFQKKIVSPSCISGSIANIDNTRMLIGFPQKDAFAGMLMLCVNGTCTEMRNNQQPIAVSSLCGRIKHGGDDERFYAYANDSANSSDGLLNIFSPVQLPNLNWKYFTEVTNEASAEKMGAACATSQSVLDSLSEVSSLVVGAPDSSGGSGKIYLIDPITGGVLLSVDGGAGEHFGASVGARVKF